MTLDELLGVTRSFQVSRIVLTAIELDVFSGIGDGATAPKAAARMQTGPRATRMLLDALVSLGLLEKRGDTYTNTELASNHLTDAGGNLRSGLLHDAFRWHTWSNLTGRIQGTVPPEEHRSLGPERHRALLAMLDRKAVERAPKLVKVVGPEGVRRLLDLGGGSAANAIAFARAVPTIEADVWELPQTAPIAEEYVARSGMQDRVRVRAADFLADDLGSGYDLILLFSVTHLLGEGQNRGLLSRCYRALAPAGRLAIHDHVLEPDKTRPLAGTIFALNMLLASAEGATYSLDEYTEWLASAGFRAVEKRGLPGAPTAVLIAIR